MEKRIIRDLKAVEMYGKISISVPKKYIQYIPRKFLIDLDLSMIKPRKEKK